MTEKRRCEARPAGFIDEVVCELDVGHNSRHSALDGTLTWEPSYVSDLRKSAGERFEALVAAVALLETPPSEWDADAACTVAWLQRLVEPS